MVAVSDLLVLITIRVELGHFLRERFHFLFDVEQMPKNGEALLQQRAPRKR